MPVKKYRVIASYVVYCDTIIEAENKDEAYDMATQMDGTSFDYNGHEDWSIDEVIEYTGVSK